MLTYNRLAVARRTYAIVAAFAEPGTGTETISERLAGWSAAETESAVRVLALHAESNAISWNGVDQQIVSGALHEESLLDDYLRMKRGEQWMAFEQG